MPVQFPAKAAITGMITLEFGGAQFRLVSRNIAEHLLALPDKGLAASGAGDLDLALAFGNPHGYTAPRAAKEMLGFTLAETGLSDPEPAGYIIFQSQIFIIFLPAPVDIPRKHAKDGIDQTCQRQKIQQRRNITLDKQTDQQQNIAQDKQEYPQLIPAIAACHKSVKP